jgi:hypothetical protein
MSNSTPLGRHREEFERDVDIDRDEKEHHHHHHGGDHWSKKYSWAVWLGVCAIFFLFFFVIIIFAVGTSNFNDTNQHIRQLDRQVSATQHKDPRNGLYSLASQEALQKGYTLSLCHQQLYRVTQVTPASTTNDRTPLKQDWLKVYDKVEQVRALASHQSSTGEKSYAVEAQLQMRFNVEAQDVGYNVDRRLTRGQKYFVLSFLLRSTYGHFSSIKLVESQLDITKNQLRAKREPVVLCTNSGSGQDVRCNRFTSHLLVEDTIILPMGSLMPGADIGQPKQASATPRVQSNPDEREVEEELARGIRVPATDREALMRQEEELSNMRSYHLVFYKETSTGEEYITLVVEPSVC